MGRLMASTTSLIAVGTMHQNDGCIVPSHVAQLHEGHRSAWSLHDLGSRPTPPTVWLPDTPDQIVTVFLALIASRVLGAPVADERIQRARVKIDVSLLPIVESLAEITQQAAGLALSATVFDGSSLDPERLMNLINLNIEISASVWSRTGSQWSNQWLVNR
jgi:hypothetical protein